jgi:hypothetical protein
MSAEGESTPRVAIGISFGNSYSSIAHTSSVGFRSISYMANTDKV